VTNVLDCVTGAAGIASAALVVAVLQPILLVLLLVAELPGGWAAVRAARIGYITNFALADSHRRKWILTDLMAERRTAAELRSFTLRHFMLARVARLAAYARDAQLKAASRQTLVRVTAQAAGGLATAGVYTALGILLALGALPLAFAGTAVLAIRSAQASLNTLLYAVNQCYEEGLYFSDYLTFCADAASRIPPAGARPAPTDFDRITADGISFTYPPRAPRHCATSASRYTGVRSSHWSARTARARPRSRRSWPACTGPTAARCAGTRPPSATSIRNRYGSGSRSSPRTTLTGP
jgi:ATP-binding cassette subfamily B protein/ATP-binding cassette subfamily C protein